MAGYIGSKASVVSSGAERKKVFAITTTTTSLTGLNYTPNLVHVFHNGIRLVDGTDYTATNGTTITLTNAAQNGDEVVVVSYATFQTSDTVSASAGGTFSNPITIDGDGGTVLTVDRATSDGFIIDVQRGGSSVGSVGSHSGFITVGQGDTSLIFDSTSNTIEPFNQNDRTSEDAAITLGWSSNRFKDLYLSGGVYLGGTGAANYLDDYEEGTWTPTVSTESGTAYTLGTPLTCRYIKIGNLVHVEAHIPFTAEGSGTITIITLPFTPSSYVEAFYGYIQAGANHRSMKVIHYSGATVLVSYADGTTYRNYWMPTSEWSPSNVFRFSGSYHV